MAIPPDELSRGCSAHLAQPVDEDGIRNAETLVVTVMASNPRDNVEFLSGYDERDILGHVFRWTADPPEQVFIDGFRARDQRNTTDDIYFNIRQYVNEAGAPMEGDNNIYGFVSTTMSSSWVPQSRRYLNQVVYRYEIYAPGGIWVAQTLSNYRYPSQDEIIYVLGINRQYIRSAQRFRLLDAGHGHVRRERVDEILLINPYFDPASHPRRLLQIQFPVDYYLTEERNRQLLEIEYVTPMSPQREKRSLMTNNNKELEDDNGTAVWYAKNVGETNSYINAGFRSYYTNEVYLFIRNEYVLVDYAPGSKGDRILNGPLFIRDGFPSLANTCFAEHGIDCAFGSYDSKEAYIFSNNLCARINFAPRTTDDKIIKGPVTIAQMFPFFKDTGFDQGVDAAFESSATYEAYVFKGDRYALINYKQPRLIGGPKKITDGYYSLKGTIFETGIEAAFASHRKNEAYLFKGDQYALINFAPGGTRDYIINGPKKITPNWPSLAELLPHKNHGLDFSGNSPR